MLLEKRGKTGPYFQEKRGKMIHKMIEKRGKIQKNVFPWEIKSSKT